MDLATIFVLFIIISGPKGEPIFHSQEFNTHQTCVDARDTILKRNKEGDNMIELGFGNSGGGWIHSKNAWCVAK